MNWDEQLIAENEALGGTTDFRMDCSIAGAQWMRRQLRTDEAVERVAREVWAESYTREKDHFEDEWKSTRNYYKVRAERLITALLGEH